MAKLMYSSYDNAVAFLKQPSEKIKMICFGVEDCPYCDDFLPDVLVKALEERKDHFEWLFVDLESAKMDFPPVSTPTAYFYIPNTDEPMPLFRVGGTTPAIIANDLDAMIEVKNGSSIQKAFFDGREPELSAWQQRFRR